MLGFSIVPEIHIALVPGIEFNRCCPFSGPITNIEVESASVSVAVDAITVVWSMY